MIASYLEFNNVIKVCCDNYANEDPDSSCLKCIFNHIEYPDGEDCYHRYDCHPLRMWTGYNFYGVVQVNEIDKG